MSISIFSRNDNPDWLEKLGLVSYDHDTPLGELSIPDESRVCLLRRYEPVAFRSLEDPAEYFSLEEFLDVVVEAERQQKLAEEAQLKHEIESLRRRGWQRIEAAYSAPDAEEIVAEGDWLGYSRAAAKAWCWNLLQYAQQDIANRGLNIQAWDTMQLQNGGLPEIAGLSDLARELEALGLTPRTYREHKEALGATMLPLTVI